MELKVLKDSSEGVLLPIDAQVKYYSTQIADAWEVVEKIISTQLPKHVGPTMLHSLRQCARDGWGVIWCSDFGYTPEVFAPTAPLAICRAALMVSKEE